jgi:thioredoxin-related protein
MRGFTSDLKRRTEMKRLLVVAMTFAAVLSTAGLRANELWTEDFAAAKAEAAKDNKDLLMDFTGSDWCGWCIRLKKEVFDQDSFKKEATKSYVFVELDYPRSKQQSDAIKKQNKELSEQFGIEGYPTIYLADSKGRPYAKTGYQQGGPEKYLASLTELQKTKTSRDELLAKADKAAGIEKAKLLDQALDVVEKAGISGGYDDIRQQVIEADKDGKAGLKGKYESRKQLKEVINMANGGDMEGALKKVDDVLKEPALTAQSKQEAYMLKANLLFNKKDKAGTIAALKAAQEADPNSEQGKQIPAIIEKLSAEGNDKK